MGYKLLILSTLFSLCFNSYASPPIQQVLVNPFLWQSKHLYHSFQFDPVRLRNIMKYGLLSRSKALEKKIHFSHNFGSPESPYFNENEWISLAASPDVNPKTGSVQYSMAFDINVNRPTAGITLIIDPTDKIDRSRQSGLEGEIQVLNSIPPNAISGIIVPQCFLNRKLSEIPFELNRRDGWALEARALQILDGVVEETGYQKSPDEIHQLIEVLKTSSASPVKSELMRALAQFVDEAYQHKLGKNEVTFEDIFNLYVPSHIPCYSIPNECEN